MAFKPEHHERPEGMWYDKKEGEQEKMPQRVFVEVGTGFHPISEIGERRFRENETYIGIDVHPKIIKSAQENTQDQKSNFIRADAATLPLGETTVDEIYFGNVFGYPPVSESQKRSFLAEAFRALRPNGLLIIGETITPADFSQAIVFLEDSGFAIDKIIRPKNNKDPDWEKEISLFKPSANVSYNSQQYLIYARKKS